MPEVWFVRHGESAVNVGRATRTPGEAELTAEGLKQAEQIASCIHRQPSLIVSSPYKRALQTANPTIKRFSTAHFEVWDVFEFTYISLPYGILTTRRDRQPLVERFWKRLNPSYQEDDKTESFIIFVKRAQRILREIIRYGKEDFIVIFSHEQFIRAAIWLLSISPDLQIEEIPQEAMKHFRQMLTTSPMPNGTILWGNIHHSEVVQSTAFEKVSCPLGYTSPTL